jgi:hypothetical protein
VLVLFSKFQSLRAPRVPYSPRDDTVYEKGILQSHTNYFIAPLYGRLNDTTDLEITFNSRAVNIVLVNAALPYMDSINLRDVTGINEKCMYNFDGDISKCPHGISEGM